MGITVFVVGVGEESDISQATLLAIAGDPNRVFRLTDHDFLVDDTHPRDIRENICNAANLCEPHPCDANAACRLLGRTFECTCNVGFVGNGFTCSGSSTPTTDSNTIQITPELTSDSTTIQTTSKPKTDSTAIQTNLKPKFHFTTVQTTSEPTTKSTTIQTTPKPITDSNTIQMTPELTSDSTTIQTTPKPTTDSTAIQTNLKPKFHFTTVQTTSEPTTKSTTIHTTPEPTTDSTTIQTTPKPITDSNTIQMTPELTSDSTTIQTTPKPTTDSTAIQTNLKPKFHFTTVQTTSEPTTKSTTIHTTPEPTTDSSAIQTIRKFTADLITIPTSVKPTTGSTTTQTTKYTTDSSTIQTTPKPTTDSTTMQTTKYTTDSTTIQTTQKPTTDSSTIETTPKTTTDSTTIQTTPKPTTDSTTIQTTPKPTTDSTTIQTTKQTTKYTSDSTTIQTTQKPTTGSTTIQTTKYTTDSSTIQTTPKPTTDSTTMQTTKYTTDSTTMQTTQKPTTGSTTMQTTKYITYSSTIQTTPKPTTDSTTIQTTPKPTTDSTTIQTTPKPTTDSSTIQTTPKPTTDSTTIQTTKQTTKYTTDSTTIQTTPKPTTDSTTIQTTPKPTTDSTTIQTTPKPTTDSTTIQTTKQTTKYTTDSTTIQTTKYTTDSSTIQTTPNYPTTDSTTIQTTANPTTILIQCPVLTAPINGSLSPTGKNSHLDVVTFRCDQGYELDGSTSATCQADGTWSDSVSDCNAVQCPVLTAPANGAMSPTGAISYPNSASFTCDSGYVLIGPAFATCQADGTWSNPGPICTPVICPARVPVAPTNGAVSPTGAVSYPNSVTFTCNSGYVRNGAAAATCQADGTWSNPVPTCTPVQCPTRTAPANGAVSPTRAVFYPNGVTFTCNSGYVRNGAAVATCQADKTWSNPVPTCTPVQCLARVSPANGAVTPTGAVSYPNSVSFTCNSGYVRNGAATATCQADGTWSNPVPTCTPRPCPTLTAPTNGILSLGPQAYPTVVTFTCNTGYVLNGAADTTCQADGTWSHHVPTCTLRQCPALTVPTNGALSPTGVTSYQTVVIFTCNQGYERAGASSVTCQANGTWSNSVPTCRAIKCPSLTPPTNGSLSPIGADTYQDVVTLRCDQGYELDGSTIATCQVDGTWNASVPVCNAIRCPNLMAPVNGALSPSGANTYLKVVTFNCDQGYRLVGSTRATCQADGTWSANVPICNAVRCPSLNAPANGSLSPVDADTYQDVVTFTCDQGYVLDGSTSVTCQAGGTWSASVPGCNDKDACLVRPCVSEATCADNPAPSLEATCTCNPGYTGDGRFLGTGCSVYTTTSIRPPVTCPSPCHTQGTCQDATPNPTCRCNTGWVGNGFNCDDVDECRSRVSPCNKARESCFNTVGSYRCNCRPWLIRFQDKCKALHRFYVRLVYNASYDYEPEKHAPSGVQYEQSKREHLRHLNYMVDSITEITRFGEPGFRRFERGSLVTFQDLTIVEGETPVSPAILEEHLQNYINENEQNSSFPFMGATVTVTDLDECMENRVTCPYGSTCLNTPGAYGCTYCSPEVAIIGGDMSITRSRAFRLTSRFSVGVNCTEQFDIAYRWEALPPAGTQWQVLVDVVNTKADLLVPSRTLNYGTYLFRFTVTVNETDTGVVVPSTSNIASVNITASSLIAGILGGFRRQVGTGRVTLDAATLSSDPDGVIPMSKNLDYTWSCNSTGPDGVCPVLNGGDEGLLTVNLGLETLPAKLIFTVEVSAPDRNAVSASQIVEVVRSTIPLTSIICDLSYGTCGPKINSGEKMRLSVLCSNCGAGPIAYMYNWTLVQQIQDSATTWTDNDWNTNILNDRNQDYVTFRANVFDRQGSYTVSAIVTDSNTTESGSSEYSFTLNQPPSVGNCAVHASDTSEGSFEIQCQGFSDSDLPLRYDFEYKATDVRVASVNSTDDSTNQHLLYSGPASSTPPIRLPIGNPDRNYELVIVIRVADALGAFAYTSVTTNVRPPEDVEEFVETVLDTLDVDDVQQTTSSIASVASLLNIANETDVENTTRIEARERMVEILEQVQVLDVQQVKQVSGPLEHVTSKPEELSDESQVKAADTLKTLEEVLTTKSSEVGTEELERIAAHLVTGAVNVLEASSQSAGRKREEAQLQNGTTDFEKNEQATTTAFQAIDNLALTMIERKFRDEKPTLVQANEFLMSLARSSCEGLGARLIQTGGDGKAYFQIPENTTTKLCVNGTVGSQAYFTPQNPFEYANNARDVRTPVLGLSVLGDRRKVLVRNLEEDERIESINPVLNTARQVNGTATSSNSGQITLHRFKTSEPDVAFYVRVTPDVTSDDVNVTLRVYLKRGDVVSPDNYSHNVTLTGTGYTSDGRTVASMQPFTWFLNQSALNISNEQEMWAIGIQRVPTIDQKGQMSDSSVPYTTSITSYKCILLNETTRRWTDNGCKVGPKTTDQQLHCICDRLTPAFAGFVAPNPLDLGSSFTFDLDRSLIALVTVCAVMALYIVAVFIGRSADLADGRKRKKARQQLSEATKGKEYLSHHLWVSVLKFPSKHFTRVQRISCCLSLLMSFMLVNIMFYQGDRNFLSKVTIGDVELALPFSLTSFIIGLESSLIVLPINVFIVMLFRYSGTRQGSSTLANASKLKNKGSHGVPLKRQHIAKLVLPRYLPKVEDVKSEFDAGYTADPTAYIEKLKKEGALKKVDTRYVIKKEGSKVTVSQKPYRPFPWWCRIVAWLLVAAIVVVSGAFTILYGNEYGRAKSQSWLFAFLISFLTDVIILQPVKIILVIIFFKLVTKKTKVTPETISIIQSRMDLMEETVWGRRREKLLHSYQGRYVRQPVSVHRYINY